jgi:hypothetical protein
MFYKTIFSTFASVACFPARSDYGHHPVNTGHIVTSGNILTVKGASHG